MIAQLVKGSLYKPKNPSSNPQHPHKKLWDVPVISTLERLRQDTRAHWPISLANHRAPGSVGDAVSEIKRRVVEKDSQCQLLHPDNAHICTCRPPPHTCIHTSTDPKMCFSAIR